MLANSLQFALLVDTAAIARMKSRTFWLPARWLRLALALNQAKAQAFKSKIVRQFAPSLLGLICFA
jgi:hypothetical protein